MIIEMGKTYQTVSGKIVRILCVDRDVKDYPVIGLIDNQITWAFTKHGKNSINSYSEYDLMEYHEKNHIIVGKIVHGIGSVYVHPNYEEYVVDAKYLQQFLENNNIKNYLNLTKFMGEVYYVEA